VLLLSCSSTKPDATLSWGREKEKTTNRVLTFPSQCARCLEDRVRRSEAARSTRRTSLSAASAASEQILKAREVSVCVVHLHVHLCEREEGGGIGESGLRSEYTGVSHHHPERAHAILFRKGARAVGRGLRRGGGARL
jgi:hypothetical protein